MLLYNNCHIINQWRWNKTLSVLFFYLANTLLPAHGQICPENIDFEKGNFSGWTCYTGSTYSENYANVISLYPTGGPVYNRHTIYAASANLRDPYGNFPVTCPNGSGYSVKLGSTEADNRAEGISYDFTVPANDNNYSLTYHYAVVFQSPHHQNFEQPRMEIEVINLTDNNIVSCASFDFVANGTALPGFHVSSIVDDTTSVLYKSWSAVSVDLSGMASKRIRLFFKTADCTYKKHFGYAYIDVDSECGSGLTGTKYCPDDTVVNLVAPHGFQQYTWYNAAQTQVLGTSQQLSMPPPAGSGTVIALKLEPFNGYGCEKTMFATLTNNLVVTADAGKDALSCNKDTLRIGTSPKAGFAYRWSPTDGLSNPAVANPYVLPGNNRQYIVATNSLGGGCRTSDSVTITSSIVNNEMQVLGKVAFCFGHGDSCVLKVNPGYRVEWFKDDVSLNQPANSILYRASQSGIYTALLKDAAGCSLLTAAQPVVIDYDRAGIAYPMKYALIDLPLQLTARPLGATVLWNPSTSLDQPLSFNPVFRGGMDELYNIEITTAGGCKFTDTQLVKAIEKIEIYIPTAFTPNSDGRNDYLRPIVRGIASIKSFKIFNRAGQLFFNAQTEQPGWDGYFKGVPQSAQAVMWVLECVGLDGVTYVRKGSTVLIR